MPKATVTFPIWAAKAIRVAKGAHMFIAFFIFGLGISVCVVLVLPFLFVLRRRGGHPAPVMQAITRHLFSRWLHFLKLGGLLDWQPPVGRAHPGPCVVVANHPGLFDILFMVRDIESLSMMVKRSLARSVGLGLILNISGYVPTAVEGDVLSGIESVEQAVARLRDGYRFAIFPEGTRSPKGGLHTFRAGAFKIAQWARVPIQPVLIFNDPPFLPHEDKWYYPPLETSHFRMTFLEPIVLSPDADVRVVAQQLEELFARRLNIRTDRTTAEPDAHGVNRPGFVGGSIA